MPAAGQYYDNFGKNKVRYAKFDWRVYHAPHFDVHYYPEEEHLLEKVTSLAESAYDSLSQEFDFQIQEPTPLLIYKTHTDFLQNNVMNAFIPEGVGAFATANLFRMVMPIDLPDPELYALIRHELTHIFQYHILFSGSLGKSLTASPPQWFMEGMASYYGEDETANDRMFLVDAAVNDVLPPITEAQGGGFFAYRYGHAAFDFIEDRWGKDGLRDFLYEFRNTLGARVGRAVERAFRIDPEDFDAEFRRWLRQKYLPQLVETGEPSDFGRPFRTDAGRGSQEISPIASPSGDLVAAFSTVKNDVDLVLFDAQKRRLLRNLTKGGSTKFQNLLAQNLTLGHRMGRDIAFSPDGNSLAVFASKREAGRALVIVDVLQGGVRRVIDMAVEQQMTPAWSPDGKHIAFAGNTEGIFDLFLLDLETLEIQNVTKDAIFDGAPAFSPDGNLLVFSSVIGDYAQLFAVDLTTGERRRMESGEANDIDPIFSSDGWRIYFTSDRNNGINNIYSLDIASREVRQHTNAVTGCYMPAVLPQPDGSDKLVYTGYWNTRFDLYLADLEAPIGEVTQAAIVEPGPVTAEDLPVFEPDIQITIDEANKEKKKGFKLFLEDAGGGVGVDDDQTFLGQVYIQMSDFFGDRRLLGIFSSVESFSNFYVNYADLSRRNAALAHAVRRARLLPVQRVRSRHRFVRARRPGLPPDRCARGLDAAVQLLSPRQRLGRLLRPQDRLHQLRGGRHRERRSDRSERHHRRRPSVRAGPVPALGQLPDRAGRAGGRYDGVGFLGPAARPPHALVRRLRAQHRQGRRRGEHARDPRLPRLPRVPADHAAQRLRLPRVRRLQRRRLPAAVLLRRLRHGARLRVPRAGGRSRFLREHRMALPVDRPAGDAGAWHSRASAGASSSTSAERGSTRSRTSTPTTRTRAGSRTRCRRTAWASPSGSSG